MSNKNITISILLSTILMIILNSFSNRYHKPRETTIVNNKFPLIEALDLTRKPVLITKDCNGKSALLTIAFVQDAQHQIDTWSKPFIEKYVNDITAYYYEVPMTAIDSLDL